MRGFGDISEQRGIARYEGTGVRKQPVLEALREEDAKRVGGSALTVRQRDRSPNLPGRTGGGGARQFCCTSRYFRVVLPDSFWCPNEV